MDSCGQDGGVGSEKAQGAEITRTGAKTVFPSEKRRGGDSNPPSLFNATKARFLLQALLAQEIMSTIRYYTHTIFILFVTPKIGQ